MSELIQFQYHFIYLFVVVVIEKIFKFKNETGRVEKQMLWINEKKISTMVKRNGKEKKIIEMVIDRTNDDYGYCYSNDMLQISDSTIYMWNFKEILSNGKI